MATRQKPAAATETPGDKPTFSLISNEKLVQIYSTMLKCRMLEARGRMLIRQGGYAVNYDLPPSQEASVVGVAIDLGPEDTISPSRCDFIASFIKGATLETIFRELIDTAKFPTPAIHAEFNALVGAAEAHKAMKKGGIAVAFANHGSTPRAVWRNALKTAGAQSLPIVFVDRKRSDRTRTNSKSKAKDPSLQMKPFGFPKIVVDSNDVVAVYRVAHEAIARARKGRGPTLIECVPYERDFRPKIESARNGGTRKQQNQTFIDPIVNMEAYLARKALFAPEIKLKLAQSFGKELDAAARSAAGARPADKANTSRGVSSVRPRKATPAKTPRSTPRSNT